MTNQENIQPIKERSLSTSLKVKIYNDVASMGIAAAVQAAKIINEVIQQKQIARLVFSTGASQFSLIEGLKQQNVDWSKVEMFHLDEYIGLEGGVDHPASFRRYLIERVIDPKLGLGIKKFHLINGNVNPTAECKRIGEELRKEVVDLAFIGIGENGHLAFNDPIADFNTTEAYHVVTLNQSCREQQVGEGWFQGGIDTVPKQAISMTVYEILRSKEIISFVPDKRKEKAVTDCLQNKESDPNKVASALVWGIEGVVPPKVTVYLDKDSGQGFV